MNKSLLIITGIIAAILSFAYFIVPDIIHVTETAYVKSSEMAAYKTLVDESDWKKWWPSLSSDGDTSFRHNNRDYRISKKLKDGVEVEITTADRNYFGIISLFSEKMDSIKIQWNSTLNAGSDPITRLSNYLQSMRIRSDIKSILKSFTTFLKDPENLYMIEHNEAV